VSSRNFSSGGSAAVFALALACSAPAEKTRLSIGTDVDAGSLDPRLMRDTTSYRVVDLLYDGLVRLDRDLSPTPGLATHWESPDPTLFVFHLREARFHDGELVSAEDVVHTFRTIVDPALGAPLRALYEPIASVEALDARTVKFALRAPYAPFLRYLDLPVVPRGAKDLATRPVGSGPYRLDRWDRGSRIALGANEDYWGGTPEIESIELVVVADNTARAQAFEAGDLDLVHSPLSPQDVNRLRADPRFVARVEPALAFTYLNFNTARAPLSDPSLRRAVAMLVDQKTILGKIYESVDEEARSILLPAWGIEADRAQPLYDPEASDALLRELGFRDVDGDGILERDGRKLAFELGTHSEDVNRVQTVEYLQNELRRHGIDARVRISDWPSFSVRRDSGDYDVILLGWTQLVDPDRGTYDQLHSGGGLNWGGYRSSRADELLEEARSTLDETARAEAYRKVASIVAEELPYFVLSYQGYHLFHRPGLSGFVPDPRGMLRSLATARIAPDP
jgi:peptide/nickel transport system substrate-binding protein